LIRIQISFQFIKEFENSKGFLFPVTSWVESSKPAHGSFPFLPFLLSCEAQLFSSLACLPLPSSAHQAGLLPSFPLFRGPLWSNASPPGLLHPHDSSRGQAEHPRHHFPCAITHRTSHRPRLCPRAPALGKDSFVSSTHRRHPYPFVKGLEPNKNGKKPRIESVSNSQQTLEESFNTFGDQHRDISPPAPGLLDL
jgi:hypothetical protein